MIDYNLLKQDRIDFIKESNKNQISIFAGTVLGQGLLISSVLKILLRTFSPFYLGRAILKKSSREYIKPIKILRNYLAENYKDISKLVPLSFVANVNLIDSICIGMLSIESINQNIAIVRNPVDKKITDNIANWALQNCQLKDI